MKNLTFKGKKIYYGWVIVIIAGFGAFFSGPGQTYSVSIFINSYVDGFGWSRSLVSGYYSFATLFVGFFFLRLMGQGSISLLPSTLVARWFSRQRVKALSVRALGGVIGSALCPP